MYPYRSLPMTKLSEDEVFKRLKSMANNNLPCK